MTSLADGLAAYCICARAEGRSPKTVRWITSSVRYFDTFLGGNPDISSITANDFRRFIIALQSAPKFAHHPYNRPQQQKISPIAIHTYCRAVKAFFSFLSREGLLEPNPVERVRLPKIPTKVVPTFSERDVQRLVSQPDKNSDAGFRDYALLLTYLDTAVRLSELAGLKVGDVDLENGYLRVTGKGDRERYVPFGQKVAKALLKYRLKHRPEPLANDYFWLCRDGRPLTAERIEKLVHDYGVRANLKRCYVHKLRHTAAVMYLRNGGDPFSLQKKLGHSSLQMTRHYVNLSDSDVRAQHLKFGVVDRLKV